MRVVQMAKFLGLGIMAAIAAVAVLVFGFGARIALDGSGRWPIVLLGSTDDHYAALEAQRAAQRTRAAASPAPSSSQARVAGATDTPTPAAQPVSVPSAALEREPSAATAPTSGEAVPQPPAAAKPQASDAGTRGAPAASAAGARDWTDFRGPKRDGVYAGAPVQLPWAQSGPRQLWKQPIGEGYASFVIAGARAFTIEQRRASEVVAAYDVATGRELWTNTWSGEFRESMGGNGPRATPTWHDGRVYALGALGELRCLRDTDGQVIWRKNILEDNGASNLQWGMSASPLVVDDLVIVLPGGRGGKSVVAYDRVTGARRWSVLDDQQSYTAPMVVTLLGTRHLVIVSAKRVAGLAIADGSLMWEYPWVTDFDVNASQPIVVSDKRLFISAGYGHGSAVFELSGTAARWQAKTVWENTRMKNRFASSVLYEGHVYGFDEAILACVDVATGDLKWKGGRYGYGQLLLAGRHLVVLTERGELALVEATPAAFREVQVVPAIEGKTWNHPSLSAGRLLIRNGNEMAAFDLRQGQ